MPAARPPPGETPLMSHALGQTSSTSSIESDEILRLAANACRCGSMARIPSYPEQFEDESLLVPLSQELDDLLLLGANSFRQRVLLSITVLEQDILANYVDSGVAIPRHLLLHLYRVVTAASFLLPYPSLMCL